MSLGLAFRIFNVSLTVASSSRREGIGLGTRSERKYAAAVNASFGWAISSSRVIPLSNSHSSHCFGSPLKRDALFGSQVTWIRRVGFCGGPMISSEDRRLSLWMNPTGSDAL